MNDINAHEYRLVSFIGLERKKLGVPPVALNQSQLGQPALKEYPWEVVKGDDFMRMGWRELQHVADILRATDARLAAHQEVEEE